MTDDFEASDALVGGVSAQDPRAAEESVPVGETQRRTIRIPDDEWERAQIAAAKTGDSISAVVRRALAAFSMNEAGDLPAYGIEYRASARESVGGKPQIVSGLTGPVDQIRSVFKAPVWSIEARDVSPYRPVKAGSKTPAGSVVPGEALADPITFHDVDVPSRDDGRLRLCIGILDDHRNRRRIPYIIRPDGKAAHVAIVGESGSGRTTTMKTIIAAAAQTYTPAEVQFYVIDAATTAFDIKQSMLADISGYPNVGNLVDVDDHELVDRVFAELKRIVDLRGREFARRNIRDFASYAKTKEAEPVPSDPYGHIFLAVDGIAELLDRREDAAAERRRDQRIVKLKSIASMGPARGVHLIVTTSTSMPAFLAGYFGLFVLHYVADTHGIPVRIDYDARAVYKTLPPNQPGRAFEPVHRLHARVAVPQQETATSAIEANMTGEAEAVDYSRGIRALGDHLAETTPTRAPTLACVPESHAWDVVWSAYQDGHPAGGLRELPLGTSIDEVQLATHRVEGRAATSALVVVGDEGSGKTTMVRSLLRSIVEQYSPDDAQVVLIDPGYGLIDEAKWLRRLGLLSVHATRPEQIETASEAIAETIAARQPDLDIVTADQIRAGTWYSGPTLFVVIEGAAAVSEVSGFVAANPTAALATALNMQRDLGMSMGLQVVATDRTHRYLDKCSGTPLYRSLRAAKADLLLLSSEGSRSIPVANSSKFVHGESRRPGLGQLFASSADGIEPVIQTAWVEPNFAASEVERDAPHTGSSGR